MTASATAFEVLLQREAIRDCIVRLARGEDRRDAGLIRQSFWPGASIDVGIAQSSLEQYLDWVVPGDPAITLTQHTLGQTLVDLREEKALAETHVTAYHRVDNGEGERDMVLGGRYLDQLEMRGQQWRIAARTLLYDWCRDDGRSMDLSRGVMGEAFSSGHYAGRAHGDYSEDFFGGVAGQ